MLWILCRLLLLKYNQCIHYVAIQNLVYSCGNVHLTTVTIIKAPLVHHVQQFSEMFIHKAYKNAFLQMALIEQKDHVGISVAW